MTLHSVPLVDLGWQQRQVQDEVREGFNRVLHRGDFVFGEDVGAFEAEFARHCGARHCVSVGSGTDALELMLRASGIGDGEVIVPSNSFIASAAAVVRAGGVPVLADVDPCTLLLTAGTAAPLITKRTKAILVVHLFGRLADMASLAVLAAARGITLLADAAQAHGAGSPERPFGLGALASATSFYPGKNLGAYGEGGAVVTDDDDLAGKVRLLRDHGSSSKYCHEIVGTNSRLDTLQAVVLRAKLPRLDSWNGLRREAVLVYDDLLSRLDLVQRPEVPGVGDHVWHIYAVRVPKRDELLVALRARGIGAGVHYPVPIHLQPAMSQYSQGPGSLPIVERAARELLSLPLYPGIAREQQERTVTALGENLR